MAKVFKVALPGYNAETDTNPNHFALYVDQLVDYVLVKEKGVAQVTVNSSLTIAHNLGYVPLCMVFAEISAGVWRRLYSRDIGGFGAYFTVDSSNLNLYNSGGNQQFIYHIFYDKIT